jgi:hypothetical protein
MVVITSFPSLNRVLGHKSPLHILRLYVFKNRSNVVLLVMPAFHVGSSIQDLRLKFCMKISSLPCALHALSPFVPLLTSFDLNLYGSRGLFGSFTCRMNKDPESVA